MIDVNAVLKVLGKRAARSQHAPDAAVSLIRDGMPAAVLDQLAHELEASLGEVQRIVGVAPATAARRRSSNATLRPTEADRAFRLARVYAFARDVLEDAGKARSWLRAPNRALRGKRPLDVLDTEIGTRQVESVLTRLEHGVYS